MNNIKEIYFSILYWGFNGYLEVAPGPQKNNVTAPTAIGRKWSILCRLVALPLKSIWYRWKFRKHPSLSGIEGKNVLFIISPNNRNSLIFLKDVLPNTVILATEQHIKNKDEIPLLYHFELLKHSWKYIGLKRAFKEKFGFRVNLYNDFLFKATGMYEASLKMLEAARPNSIIFTNDHNPAPRALLLAAKKLDIPNVYIQHASTTPYFPPLIYDLSLLDGPFTKEKYETQGPISGTVRYIGMPKFERFLKHRTSRKEVERIGICSNTIDPEDSILELVHALDKAFPEMEISYRAHPSDPRSLNLPKRFQLSNARTENSFDFLQRQDVIVAGNTSIHLEAALLNVPGAYYRFGEILPEVDDYYGFVKKGLVPATSSTEELIDFIRSQMVKRDTVYLRCKPFDALVGTEHDGKGAELAGQYLMEFINEHSNSV